MKAITGGVEMKTYTISEAAEILGVSRWTLSKAVKEGTVKAVVLRKWPRISEEELKRLTAPKEEPKEKEV